MGGALLAGVRARFVASNLPEITKLAVRGQPDNDRAFFALLADAEPQVALGRFEEAAAAHAAGAAARRFWALAPKRVLATAARVARPKPRRTLLKPVLALALADGQLAVCRALVGDHVADLDLHIARAEKDPRGHQNAFRARLEAWVAAGGKAQALLDVELAALSGPDVHHGMHLALISLADDRTSGVTADDVLAALASHRRSGPIWDDITRDLLTYFLRAAPQHVERVAMPILANAAHGDRFDDLDRLYALIAERNTKATKALQLRLRTACESAPPATAMRALIVTLQHLAPAQRRLTLDPIFGPPPHAGQHLIEANLQDNLRAAALGAGVDARTVAAGCVRAQLTALEGGLVQSLEPDAIKRFAAAGGTETPQAYEQLCAEYRRALRQATDRPPTLLAGWVDAICAVGHRPLFERQLIATIRAVDCDRALTEGLLVAATRRPAGQSELAEAVFSATEVALDDNWPAVAVAACRAAPRHAAHLPALRERLSREPPEPVSGVTLRPTTGAGRWGEAMAWLLHPVPYAGAGEPGDQ